MGSGIELACIVRPSRPSAKIPQPTWSKSGKPLLEHVNVYHMNGTNEKFVTGLHIEKARKTDSGEYTCSIGELSKATVQIHVLN
ncbi:hypothetical protein PV325_012452, partial [Microctonus aethiopoides]